MFEQAAKRVTTPESSQARAAVLAPDSADSAALLDLQSTLGNRIVQRLIRDQLIQRQAAAASTIQRWAQPESVEFVLGLLEQATPDDLHAFIASVDRGPASSADQVQLTLPGRTILAVSVADALELRSIATNRLEGLLIGLMDAFANDRQAFVDRVNGAADEVERRAAIVATHAFDAPRLAELRLATQGRPAPWTYPDASPESHPGEPRPAAPVLQAVLGAIQLEAEFRAEGRLAAPGGVQAAVTSAVGMDLGSEWCGFFVYVDFAESSLDSDLVGGFFAVGNVEDYFTYAYESGPKSRVKKWIFAENTWHDLKEYHASRGSSRTWLTAAQIATASDLDIRPGDIVLIDWLGGPEPEHISMVQSYDPHTRVLFTIGGNDTGYVVDTKRAPGSDPHPDRQRALAEQATGQHLKAGSPKVGSVAVDEYDLGAPGAQRVRVYGIGRPSIVDFENHAYDNSDHTAKPSARPRH